MSNPKLYWNQIMLAQSSCIRIIPALRGAKFIELTISSVEAQTTRLAERIISNDSSTEAPISTVAWLNDFLYHSMRRNAHS